MLDSAALLSSAQDSYTISMQNRLHSQNKPDQYLSAEQARQAADQFESFFIGQMLEYMHTDVNGQGYFGGGHAEDVWRSMLNQEYGKEIAKSSSLGIADAVMRSLLSTQEKASNLSPMANPAASSSDTTPVATAVAQYSKRMN